MSLEWCKDDIRVVSIMPLWDKTSLAGVEAKSTRRLGVRIEPGDVANPVWKAVHPKSFLERQRQDCPVSFPDPVLRWSTRITPARSWDRPTGSSLAGGTGRQDGKAPGEVPALSASRSFRATPRR